MSPALLYKLTAPGKIAEFRDLSGARRRGVVVRCSADGMKLYLRPYARNGYSLADKPVPVPADQVSTIWMPATSHVAQAKQPKKRADA